MKITFIKGEVGKKAQYNILWILPFAA